jgi:hypothetical protein
LELLIHDGALAPDWSDEVIARTALTRADASGQSRQSQAA